MVKASSPEKRDIPKDIDEIEDENDDQEKTEEAGEEPQDFEVERVDGHRYDGKVLKFYLKWDGYDEEDNTWEREDSCACLSLIEDYWDGYLASGGKKTDKEGYWDHKPVPTGPVVAKRGVSVTKSPSASTATATGSSLSSSKKAVPIKVESTKRAVQQEPLLPDLDPLDNEEEEEEVPKKKQPKAKSSTATSLASSLKKKDRDGDIEMTSAPAKKQKVSKAAEKDRYESEEPENTTAALGPEAKNTWEPPVEWSSWENEVDEIMNVERNNAKMRVYIRWNNGHETRHDIDQAHKHCPLKLINFYESHLKFTQA
ncbi:hypothetical protein BGZ83_002094 [Gryganskiella cystojenkinii]|nr:hypothetical protein BGZ83_002094 [Gryganskiella cystojenkinii]